MAILKYLVFLLLLLGVGYLILGLNSSYHYSNKMAIVSTPDKAMDYVINPMNLSLWDERIKRVTKNDDGSHQFLLGEEAESVQLRTTRIERDSFIWEGEWLAPGWSKNVKYHWKQENVLCSLFIDETIIGNGFLNTAKQAWNIGSRDHERDQYYDSLKVRIEAHYLRN